MTIPVNKKLAVAANVRWSFLGDPIKRDGRNYYKTAEVKSLDDGSTRRFEVGDCFHANSSTDNSDDFWVGQIVEMYDSSPDSSTIDEVQIVYDSQRMRIVVRWFFAPEDIARESKRVLYSSLRSRCKHERFWSDEISYTENILEVIDGRVFVFASVEDRKKFQFPTNHQPGNRYWPGDKLCVTRYYYGNYAGVPPPVRELEKDELEFLVENPTTQRLYKRSRTERRFGHEPAMKSSDSRGNTTNRITSTTSARKQNGPGKSAASSSSTTKKAVSAGVRKAALSTASISNKTPTRKPRISRKTTGVSKVPMTARKIATATKLDNVNRPTGLRRSKRIGSCRAAHFVENSENEDVAIDASSKAALPSSSNTAKETAKSADRGAVISSPPVRDEPTSEIKDSIQVQQREEEKNETPVKTSGRSKKRSFETIEAEGSFGHKKKDEQTERDPKRPREAVVEPDVGPDMITADAVQVSGVSTAQPFDTTGLSNVNEDAIETNAQDHPGASLENGTNTREEAVNLITIPPQMMMGMVEAVGNMSEEAQRYCAENVNAHVQLIGHVVNQMGFDITNMTVEEKNAVVQNVLGSILIRPDSS